MATITPHLTIAPFLQHYDVASRSLTVNIIVIPVGDPRDPLSDGFVGVVPDAPPFVGAGLVLQAHVASDANTLPTRADVAPAPGNLPLPAAPKQKAIFDELADRYEITKLQTLPERNADLTLRTWLPDSYRAAFPFVEPRTQLAVTDDTYHCARQCPPATKPIVMAPDPRISWGDAFAALMRQPTTARAAGLLYTVQIDATLFSAGGFLFFSLASGSNFREQADADATFIDLFATRVPVLNAAAARPVFTPVLFPVAADAASVATLGSFDDAFAEALRFDDGFARIVHCNQPTGADPNAAPGTRQSPPVTDLGLQLGWDDEDVVVALNRALSPAEPGKPAPAVAPPGFSGWRVDARRVGSSVWSSLCRVSSGGYAFGADMDPFEDELGVEVQPGRLGDSMWLQPYSTRWRSRSLVAPSREEELLAGRRDPESVPYEAIGLEQVPLRYGVEYQFRVRMRDVTGGGPDVTAERFHSAEAGVATWRMRRFVPPGPVAVAPGAPDTVGLPEAFTLHRPRLGWPEAVYTGLSGAQEQLEAQLNQDRTSGGGQAHGISLPDADVEVVELRVLVRQPRFDDFADADGYVELYTAHRAFPALRADGTDPGINLDISWVDASQLDASVTAPSTYASPGLGAVLLPTARDVRLVARAACRDDATYFGSPSVRFGPPVALLDGVVRAPASEDAILSPHSGEPLVSVFLRPAPPEPSVDSAVATSMDPSTVYLRRLAAAAGLHESHGSLLADSGERAAFGVFGLAHAMAPDSASVRLTTTADLPEMWINVLRLTVERDWTWLSPEEPAFTVERSLVDRSTGLRFRPPELLGGVSFPHVINRRTVTGSQDRSLSTVIVIDAFDPPLDVSGLPQEVEAQYSIIAAGYQGAQPPVALVTRLPITTAPTDVPRLVSAGHAFSDYRVIGDYEETGDRRRLLWLEFAAPPRDPRDIYFGRVLARAPDPLLMPTASPGADPHEYTEMLLDPELVRVVRPGQSDDFAGLSAMQPLIPAGGSGAPVHYLLPLPPDLTPEAADLFGFFTYEFRVGHARAAAGTSFWSTAAGRYGPGMIVDGVRHPLPTMPCAVSRSSLSGVEVSSEFAVAVDRGRRVTVLPPATQLWFVLYARVPQADGTTNRNVQIGLRQASVVTPPLAPIPPGIRTHIPAARPQSARLAARSAWTPDELSSTLATWALPPETPLGVVAVEVLPEPNGTVADPLNGDLGQVRILRSSRLVDAGAICCA